MIGALKNFETHCFMTKTFKYRNKTRNSSIGRGRRPRRPAEITLNEQNHMDMIGHNYILIYMNIWYTFPRLYKLFCDFSDTGKIYTRGVEGAAPYNFYTPNS